MQATKKLVLVDEADREYKRLQRPVDAVAKTSQSLQLSDTLRNQTIADDQYDGLFAGTGKLCKDEGLYISREDFGNGYALYAFDLSADLGEDDHFSLVRQGSVRLALKFAAALGATVSVVAYAKFENIIEVDRDRNVVFDYGV